MGRCERGEQRGVVPTPHPPLTPPPPNSHATCITVCLDVPVLFVLVILSTNIVMSVSFHLCSLRLAGSLVSFYFCTVLITHDYNSFAQEKKCRKIIIKESYSVFVFAAGGVM